MVNNAQINPTPDSKLYSYLSAGASVVAGAGLSLLLPVAQSANNAQAQEAIPLAPVIQDNPSISAEGNASVLAPMQDAIEEAAQPLLPQVDNAAIFQEAETLMAGSQFRNAYDLLGQIAPDHPDYEKAQELRKDSAWEIVVRAVAKEREGNRSVAILHMKRVPPDSNAYAVAQGYLDEWQSGSDNQANTVDERR